MDTYCFILTGKIYLKIKSIIKDPISFLKVIVAYFLIICLFGFVFVFGYYTYFEFRRDLVIEVMDLPKELQEKGYTKQMLLKMITAQLVIIDESAKVSFPGYDTSLEAEALSESISAENQGKPEFKSLRRIGDVSSEDTQKLEVKFQGISIPIISFMKFFVNYIKSFVGYPRTHVVCNVTMQGNSENLKIITQIDSNLKNIKRGSLENLDSTMAAIAEDICKYKKPFDLAQYLYNNRRYPDCLEIIRYCIENYPQNYSHSAYNLWGRILYVDPNGGDKKYDNAINKYKMATRLHPNFAAAYYNWGLALHDKGQKYYEEAIVQYKKALDNAEQDYLRAPAYFNLGLILTTQGIIKGSSDGAKEKYQEAKENYQKALKCGLRPTLPNIYTNLGTVFGAQGYYDDAIEMYKKAVGINPLFAGYFNWGAALYRKGEYGKAIEKLEMATEIKSSDIAYFLLGDAYNKMENKDKAIDNFQKYLELSNDNQLKAEVENFIKELTGITK